MRSALPGSSPTPVSSTRNTISRSLLAAARGSAAASTQTCPPWGVNLIHSPDDPQLEEALVDLYLASGVTRVSASAFMALSPAIVRYAAADPDIHLFTDADRVGQRDLGVFAEIGRYEDAVQVDHGASIK